MGSYRECHEWSTSRSDRGVAVKAERKLAPHEHIAAVAREARCVTWKLSHIRITSCGDPVRGRHGMTRRAGFRLMASRAVPECTASSLSVGMTDLKRRDSRDHNKSKCSELKDLLHGLHAP